MPSRPTRSSTCSSTFESTITSKPPSGTSLEHVSLAEVEPGVPVAGAREGEMVRVVVDPDDGRAGSLDEVVGELPLARADVEDALAGTNPLDEEVVVAGQPVLHVDAAVVGDRCLVERATGGLLQAQELAERATPVGIRCDDREPEAHRTAKDRYEKAERSTRHAAGGPTDDAARRQRPTHAGRSTKPRRSPSQSGSSRS